MKKRMRSERGTRLLAVLAGAIPLAAGCAAAPVSYGPGVSWTVPMTAPLAAEAIVIPATVHGQGPYLFVIDPDAQASLIDRGVAEALGLYTGPDSWVGFLEAQDRVVRRRPYEVLWFRSGDLSLENVVMYSAPAGTLYAGGRPVQGVLGRDVLSTTIVLDVDRDAGVVRLALTGHQAPLAAAVRIPGQRISVDGPERKVVIPARVGDAEVDLAVTLSAAQTAVWSSAGRGASSGDPARRAAVVVDDLPAAELTLGGDRDWRVRRGLLDGVLGQDYLARYRVRFDGDQHDLWLAPRDHDLGAGAAARIGRWGDTFRHCAALGCVEVAFVADGLAVMPTAEAPASRFDVVLEALDASGAPLGRPLLRASIGDGARVVLAAAELSAWPGAARFRVVDASPHGSPCGEAACFVALTGAD